MTSWIVDETTVIKQEITQNSIFKACINKKAIVLWSLKLFIASSLEEKYKVW